jgi:hypothetical protein
MPRVLKAAPNKKPGFYSNALDKAEKLSLEEARDIEGLDEEIAMLRVRLRELIENDPDRFDLQLKVTSTIARLVGIRYKISREQKKSLREAITKVLTDIAIPLGIKVIIK